MTAVPPEAGDPVSAGPHPEGNPALAAAAEAILNRRLAAFHGSGQGEARRAAILLDALPDAAAAIEAAAPHIAAAERERILALLGQEAARLESAPHPQADPSGAAALRDFAALLADAAPEATDA